MLDDDDILDERKVRHNKTNSSGHKSPKKEKGFLLEWGPWFLITIIVCCIAKFGIMKATIPSSSMVPTLNVEDRLIVNKFAKNSIERGDIVVFQSDEFNEIFIKRAIGLAGDHIEISKGIVKVNGEPVGEDYVKNNDYDYEGTFDVPEGKIFFLGDNRPKSNDARYWENPYIDEDKVLGKAVFRYSPLDEMGFLK